MKPAAAAFWFTRRFWIPESGGRTPDFTKIKDLPVGFDEVFSRIKAFKAYKLYLPMQRFARQTCYWLASASTCTRLHKQVQCISLYRMCAYRNTQY